MLKVSLCCAVAAGALLAASAAAWAADPYTFALVPKSTNNPFYDQALAGCKKAEAELKGAIKCLYIGPNEHGGGDEQAQIVGDLITKKVDGIAVSPANAAAIAAALQGAKAANIPIITWDSDLLEKDKGLRATYIGTHNYDIGVNLAKLVMEAKPKGGTICIQSGGAAAANHNERMQGVRDTLAAKKSAEAPGEKLTGQNGWTEVDGCPQYTNDDFPLAMQMEQDLLNKDPTASEVTVVDYPDGRLAIRDRGVALAYRTFDKIQQVDQGAIIENKRLGAALAFIREEQLRREPLRRSTKAPRRRDQRDARLFKVG